MDFLLWFSENAWRLLLFTVIILVPSILLTLSWIFYDPADSFKKIIGTFLFFAFLCSLIMFITLIKPENDNVILNESVYHFIRYWGAVTSLSLLIISFLCTLMLGVKDYIIETIKSIKSFWRNRFSKKARLWKTKNFEKLKKTLKSEDGYTRYIAIRVLGTIQDKRAIKPLMQLLKEDSRNEDEILISIFKLGNHDILEKIEKKLDVNKSYSAEIAYRLRDEKANYPTLFSENISKKIDAVIEKDKQRWREREQRMREIEYERNKVYDKPDGFLWR